MGYLDFIQGAQDVLHPIDATNRDKIKSQITEMRQQTQAAGLPFPDSPVSLPEALKFYSKLQEQQGQKVEAQQKLQTQQQGDLQTPPVPLDPLELVRGIQRSVEQSGGQLDPKALQGLLSAATSQGNVGMRNPITAQPSVFSQAPSNTLLTAPENQQFINNAKLNTPIQQGDLARLNQSLDLQKKQNEAIQTPTTHVIKDPSSGDWRQVMVDKEGNWVKDLGPASPEQTRPLEATYTRWESVINSRIQQLLKTTKLTDIEQAQVAGAPSADQMSLLAELFAKKGLSKDAVDKVTTGMEKFDTLRSKGYDMLNSGDNPFKLLSTPSSSQISSDKLSKTLSNLKSLYSDQTGGDSSAITPTPPEQTNAPIALQPNQHFMKTDPDASAMKGWLKTDPKTGEKFQSDGTKWIPYKSKKGSSK